MSDFRYLLSIDPGKSTGVALGKFNDETPYTVVEGWQFAGGVVGLTRWVADHYEPHRADIPGEFHLHWDNPDLHTPSFTTSIISEKYTPRPNAKFGQTMDSTEPLRCEGALIALNVMPDYPSKTWVQPPAQYFVGGGTKVEKRKRLKKFLKDTGNYRFGKDLGAPDNEDFVSATAHGYSYAMKVLGNRASFDQATAWSDKN